MGAWGYGIYDNDTAMDAKYDLEEMKDSDIKNLTNLGHLLDENESIYVVIDTFIKKFGKVTDDAWEIFLHAYKEDICNLEPWNEPEKRKEVLEEFYEVVELYRNPSEIEKTLLTRYPFGQIVTENYCKGNEYLINLKSPNKENLERYLNLKIRLNDNIEGIDEIIEKFLDSETKNEFMIRGNEYSINLTHDSEDILLDYAEKLVGFFKPYVSYMMNSNRK